jgi:hypothetical protein
MINHLASLHYGLFYSAYVPRRVCLETQFSPRFPFKFGSQKNVKFRISQIYPVKCLIFRHAKCREKIAYSSNLSQITRYYFQRFTDWTTHNWIRTTHIRKTHLRTAVLRKRPTFHNWTYNRTELRKLQKLGLLKFSRSKLSLSKFSRTKLGRSMFSRSKFSRWIFSEVATA